MTSVDGVLVNFDDGSSYVVCCENSYNYEVEYRDVFEEYVHNPDLFTDAFRYTRVNVTDCVVAGSGYKTGTYVRAWRLTSQWLVWFRDSYLYGRIPMHDRSVVPVFGPCFLSYHGTVGVSGLETMKGSDFFAWPLDGHGVSDVRWPE